MPAKYWVDHSTEWVGTIDALIEHGTITTPSCGQHREDFMDNANHMLTKHKVRYSEYQDHEIRFVGVDHMRQDERGRSYFFIKLVGPIKTNKDAKRLLDAQY